MDAQKLFAVDCLNLNSTSSHFTPNDRITYLKVTPVPIWPLAKRHDFPQEYTKTPDVTRRAELPVFNRLGRCPTYWNLSSL